MRSLLALVVVSICLGLAACGSDAGPSAAAGDFDETPAGRWIGDGNAEVVIRQTGRMTWGIDGQDVDGTWEQTGPGAFTITWADGRTSEATFTRNSAEMNLTVDGTTYELENE